MLFQQLLTTPALTMNDAAVIVVEDARKPAPAVTAPRTAQRAT